MLWGGGGGGAKKDVPEVPARDAVLREATKINLVVEYRMPMPMTTEEYRRGQLYVTAKSTWQASLSSAGSGGGEGVAVLENERDSEMHPNVKVHGRHPKREDHAKQGAQRTVKHIHFGKALPRVVGAILPKEAKFIEERCWNSYPYILTLYTSKQSFLANRLYISVESIHNDADHGNTDNVFGLSDEELKQREVVHMDIAHTHVGNPPDMPEAGKEQPASPGVPKTTPGDGNLVPVGDPRGVRSAKTGRGPLREKGWEKQAAPVMCAYKLVRMTCDVPFHSKIERAVLKSAIHDLVLNAHKNIFCSLDEWAWLDVETIRDFEKRAFAAAASAIEGDMCPAEKLDLPESPAQMPAWVQGGASSSAAAGAPAASSSAFAAAAPAEPAGSSDKEAGASAEAQASAAPAAGQEVASPQPVVAQAPPAESPDAKKEQES